MEVKIEKLGKVAITIEKELWTPNKSYDKLTIVREDNDTNRSFISRKPVPSGILLTNTTYWVPFVADTVTGRSAYEVAVENGFSGSEIQWLQSLKGSKGDRGDSGIHIDTDNMLIYNDVSELSGKTVAQKNVMLADGNVIEKLNNTVAGVLTGYDYFANILSEYGRVGRKYIKAIDGQNYSSYYGNSSPTSGNYFWVSSYIDASSIDQLQYKYSFYCKENVAIIAAYDSNHTYLKEHSLIANTYHNTVAKSGIWEKDPSVAYIRFSYCTRTISQYMRTILSLSSLNERLKILENEDEDIDPPVLTVNPDILAILTQMRYRGNTATTGSNPGQTKTDTTVLLHLSDIHGNNANAKRITEFKNYYSEYLDDAINTGDTVANTHGNPTPQSKIIDFDSILTAIGNHDTAIQSSSYDWYAHQGLDAYNKFIKPYIVNTTVEEGVTTIEPRWGDFVGTEAELEQYIVDHPDNVPVTPVIQPDNAKTNGYCYYYKDYPSGVRLIVLDSMDTTTIQTLWLEHILSLSYNKHVVIAVHYIPGDINAFDCGFSNVTFQENNVIYNNNESLNWIVKVKNYISYLDSHTNLTGKFVCWLVGHRHTDICGTLVDNPKQIVVRVALAAYNNSNATVSRINNNATTDDFNIVCIDPANTLLQLAKVGSSYNRYLKHRTPVCINYNTQTIINK